MVSEKPEGQHQIAFVHLNNPLNEFYLQRPESCRVILSLQPQSHGSEISFHLVQQAMVMRWMDNRMAIVETPSCLN